MELPSATARALLVAIGAPSRLIRHGELVGEAAAEILSALFGVVPPGFDLDRTRVLLGAWLHDAGKSVHPSELAGPGHSHEAAGEGLLLERGVDPRVARMCRTHAQWKEMHNEEVTLEDLLVALADSLWKGRRDATLEARVIDAVAARAGADRWSLFTPLDDTFERVAAGADARLARSVELES